MKHRMKYYIQLSESKLQMVKGRGSSIPIPSFTCWAIWFLTFHDAKKVVNKKREAILDILNKDCL